MTACKHIASMGAAATGEADRKSAAEERKPSIKRGKKKKAKGKLAVKSNGAEKPKTYDLSDVTRRLAVMSITEEDDKLAQLTYQNAFWMENFKGVYDKPSVHAIFKKAAENWKFFNDSDKAPYVARALVNKVILAKATEFEKTLKLTRLMMNKMMDLKM